MKRVIPRAAVIAALLLPPAALPVALWAAAHPAVTRPPRARAVNPGLTAVDAAALRGGWQR